MDAEPFVRGQLLIASPALREPNFHRTVVLVAEHGEEGAMGLVLNRPSQAAASEATPVLAHLVESDAVVHFGGPVEPQAVIVLAEFDDPDDSASIVFGDIGFIRGDSDPELLGEGTRRVRLFAGYAGWGAGQLEAELAEESWILEPPTREDVFSDAPEDLWSAVLRRKGGPFALVATMPPDPSMN